MTEEMSRLIQIQKQVDELSKEAKQLKKVVTQQLSDAHQSCVTSEGYTIELTEGTRTTMKKEALAEFLASKNLRSYVSIEYQPNAQLVLNAVQSGILTQEEVEPYLKVTPTQTLKVKASS